MQKLLRKYIFYRAKEKGVKFWEASIAHCWSFHGSVLPLVESIIWTGQGGSLHVIELYLLTVALESGFFAEFASRQLNGAVILYYFFFFFLNFFILLLFSPVHKITSLHHLTRNHLSHIKKALSQLIYTSQFLTYFDSQFDLPW